MSSMFSLLGLVIATWILYLLALINQIFVVGPGLETGLWAILFLLLSSVIFKKIEEKNAT